MSLLHESRRRVGVLIVAGLIALLPFVYVAFGSRHTPFAKDLRNHPERFQHGEALLVLNRVIRTGDGFVEVGEPGGTAILDADPAFGLEAGEELDLTVAVRDGRFAVVDVGRHPTRSGKWIVSFPVLVLVGLLVLARVRWSPAEMGLVVSRRDRA